MGANFGNVAADYAKFRDAIPTILFEQLAERGVHFHGRRVVDLGAGTGIFSRSLQSQGARVDGVECSPELIRQAERIDQELGISIAYHPGTAERTELPDHDADIVTAVRAWHWFDRAKALHEIRRIIKPNGYLIVIDSIFVPQLSEIARKTLEIAQNCIGALRPAGSKAETGDRMHGFPANWFPEWEHAGFALLDTWQYDYELSFTGSEWCGKIRSLSWATGLAPSLKQELEKQLIDYLQTRGEPFNIPHRYAVALLKNLDRNRQVIDKIKIKCF